MRNVVVVVLLLVIAAVAWWKWPHSTAPGTTASPTSAAATAATAPVAIPVGKPNGVRRLPPDERRRLGLQIEAGLRQRRAAAATATGSTAAPGLDEDPVLRVEDVAKPVRDAFEAAIPLLATCYQKAGSAAPKTPLVRMTIISDPELGSVIDNAAVTDAEDKPLEHSLDECLRDTIDSLALPPLGKPGKLPIQYTFKLE